MFIIDFPTTDEFYQELALLLKTVIENYGNELDQKINHEIFHNLLNVFKPKNYGCGSTSSFKETCFKKQEFFEFGKNFNEEITLVNKYHYIKYYEKVPKKGYEDVAGLKKTEILSFDTSIPQNYTKNMSEIPGLRIEIFKLLNDIIDNSRNNEKNVIKIIIKQIIESKEEIAKKVFPYLYLTAYRSLKLIEKLCCYYIKVFIHQYQSPKIEDFPKNFQLNQNDNSQIYEIFAHCERNSLNINEKFTSKVQRTLFFLDKILNFSRVL